jgi:hypothetical protein
VASTRRVVRRLKVEAEKGFGIRGTEIEPPWIGRIRSRPSREIDRETVEAILFSVGKSLRNKFDYGKGIWNLSVEFTRR